MKLYILRHGHAEAQVTADEVRALTSTGRADTEAVLRKRALDLQGIGSIWSSPLVRAQQTANIALTFFPSIRLQTTSLLIPEASPQGLVNWLAETVRPESESMLLVSHQPLVGSLVNLLCNKAEGYYPMGTSSLAAVDLDVIALGCGSLCWLEHVGE